MRLVSIVLVIWLLIGVAAAAQRGYFSGGDASCNNVSDTVLTVVAGPLNYLGVNPQIDCKTPEPSE